MPDGDEVANVDESPPPRIEEGLGLGTVAELSNREVRAASGGVGDGGDNLEAVVVGSAGLEPGGSDVRGGVEVDGVEIGESGVALESHEETQTVAGNDVKIDREDELEVVKDEGEVGEGSEMRRELDAVNVDSDVKLETVATTEDVGMDDVVEEKGEFEKNLAACGDMERIDEASKTVKVEDGEANVAGNADLSGMVVEDCHTKDVVEEKGDGFEKNVAEEDCAVLTACSEMEQVGQSSGKVKEDGGEGDSDLIGTGIDDCHVATSVEEKGEEFEKNLAAELCAVVATVDGMHRIDESRNTLKEEDVVDENVAVISDLVTADSHMNDAVEEKGNEFENKLAVEQSLVITAIGDAYQIDESNNTSNEEEIEVEDVARNSDLVGVDTEDSHMHDAVDEKGGELETKLAAEQCAVMTAIGDADQIDESKNTLKEEEVLDVNAAGNCNITGIVVEDSHMNDVLADKGEEFEKNLAAEQCVVVATIGGMDQKDESRNKLKENEVGEENVAGDSGMLDVELTGDHIGKSDNVENEDGDDDEELGSEEETTESKEKLEEDCLAAAPDVEFSLHNVVLDTTTGEDDEEFVDGEEPSVADAGIEARIDTPDADKSSARPKRGRKPSKAALIKKTEEDVCFICFDGGDLVVCDRRGCPKVYHPSCVNRDEAFFKAKGRWNCGWHLCSKCEKNAQYMCLTCTFSLCKGCIKDIDFYSVRGNKGFCETCFKTVNLIECKEKGNNEEKFNFDDKTCWESLFKDYWMDMKENLQLTSEELAQAKNPWKVSDGVTSKQKSADETFNVNNNAESGSNNSLGNVIAATPKRKKSKRQSKPVAKGEDSPSGSDSSGNGNKSKRRKTKKQTTLLRKRGLSGNIGAGGIDAGSKWASTELLKFVMHMRNGDVSILSQFEVQELLLEYIKTNKLRDPRRKSQIICDAMLKGLFRKQRVGHFEMLKLLESHFFMNEDGHGDEFHGSSVDNGSSPVDELVKTDASAKTNKDKKRKMRKKGFGSGSQSNTADYAAIDIHNISLVFLRRNLMEILLEDVDNFQDKVVGAFVRIKITGSNQIQDMYRLVQIVGTTKAPMPYKVGKRTTDINLEIQNLNKREVVSIDIISSQEFTEDECNRLRQSIKCGLIPRLTVGDILEKAMDLQAARVNDWLETEMIRLRHLCDRASDMGRRKELRENVEKLQNLKKPEERQRRLEEIPEVHSDPKMDPSYESDEEEEEADDRKQESFLRPRGSGFNRQGKDTLSPRKGGSVATDSWSGTKGHTGTGRELGRTLSSKGISNKGEDTSLTAELTRVHGSCYEKELVNTRDRQKVPYSPQLGSGNTQAAVASEPVSGVVPDFHQATFSSVPSQTAATVNESEKMWHYKDPSGKVQGPFSIVQLRKWNSTGFFPKDLTIWKTNEDLDDAILLLDALAGKFHKDTKLIDNLSNKSSIALSRQSSLSHPGRIVANASMANSDSPSQLSSVGHTRLSVDVSVSSAGAENSGYDNRNEFANLPSPTPNQIVGSTGGEASVNRLSSGSRSVPGSLSADTTQLYRSATATSAANPYQTSYSQRTSSTGYHLQQPVQSAANPRAESRVSVSTAPSMMQAVASQPSGHNASNNQIPLSASNAYNQWSNLAAASTEKPGGSFANQGFLGTPAATTWMPPTAANNQPGMQPMVLPDQSWRPVTGNPNMGWGVVQGNANASWTPTGQATPQMNPNWGVQGTVPVIGNATASWVPSGNNMTGYVAQVNNQVGGIMNPGWSGPTTMNTNTNQSWASAGQGTLPNSATHNNNTNNQGSWANGQNVNGRYSNNRQQGGEGGYHHQRGGQPRVCEYYLSNRCRKGSACKWLHPQRQ